MLIDGHFSDRNVLKRAFLHDLGGIFRIFEAESGEEGLKLAEVLKIDCMILEWDLPDLSGEEVLATLLVRCEQLYCPVVVYSRRLNPELSQLARAYGAQASFRKGQAPVRVVANRCLRLMGVGDLRGRMNTQPIALTSSRQPVFVSTYG